MTLDRHIPERRKKRLDRNYNWNLKIKDFFHIKHNEDKYFQHKIEFNWDEEPKIIPFYIEKCKKTKTKTLEIIDKIDARRENSTYRFLNLFSFLGGSFLYTVCFLLFVLTFPNLAQYQINDDIMINSLKFSFDDLYVAGMLLLLMPLAYYWFQEYSIYNDRRILAIECDILYSWLKEGILQEEAHKSFTEFNDNLLKKN